MNQKLVEALHDAFNEARATARVTADMSLSGPDIRAAFKADDEAVARFVELVKAVGESPERRPDGLRAPEEVASDLGVISPSTIRTLIRDGHIEYTPLARGKFALTDARRTACSRTSRRKRRPGTRKPGRPRVADSPFPAPRRDPKAHARNYLTRRKDRSNDNIVEHHVLISEGTRMPIECYSPNHSGNTPEVQPFNWGEPMKRSPIPHVFDGWLWAERRRSAVQHASGRSPGLIAQGHDLRSHA